MSNKKKIFFVEIIIFSYYIITMKDLTNIILGYEKTIDLRDDEPQYKMPEGVADMPLVLQEGMKFELASGPILIQTIAKNDGNLKIDVKATYTEGAGGDQTHSFTSVADFKSHFDWSDLQRIVAA